MSGYNKDKVIKEITPLSDKDFFYIADRSKRGFTYPIHSHTDYELNFTENSKAMREIPYETSSYYILDHAYNKFS